jgi:hypothetical protein
MRLVDVGKHTMKTREQVMEKETEMLENYIAVSNNLSLSKKSCSKLFPYLPIYV